MTDYPVVKLSAFNVAESNFVCDDKQYRVKDLIKLAEDLEPFDLPLVGIDLSFRPWGKSNIKSFCYHMQRVRDSDLSYPIILDTDGFIADGWHRVCKSIGEGRQTIKAVRLTVMPEPI